MENVMEFAFATNKMNVNSKKRNSQPKYIFLVNS